ncbi:MAG: molybdenum cofactor guanylyltransferase, partial [Pseudomonadota bacterium]
MTYPYEITGIILAGGESRRMGRSKAFLEIGGQPLVARVVSTMVKVCREVMIVTKNPLDYLDFDLKIVRDLVPGQGPLGGLATGLFYAHYDWALAVGCDLPFLQAALLANLAERALSS